MSRTYLDVILRTLLQQRLLLLPDLLGKLILLNMVTTQSSPEEFDAIEIIHRKNRTPLVLIFDESESQGLVCVLISDQIDIYLMSSEEC